MAKAFPKSLEPVVISISERLNLDSRIEPHPGYTVTLDGGEIEIPYRIYYEIPDKSIFGEIENQILSCYFTRHYDGFTRESNLREIIKNKNYFVTPYVIQLIGEYVVQNMQVILDNIDVPLLENIKRFKSENKIYFNKTVARVNSYWDVYYKRAEYPKWDQYPGNKILRTINRFLNEGKVV